MRLSAPRYDFWIVAVPVVFALVLGYALRQLFIWFAMVLHVGQEAIFLVEAGPFSLRTTILVLLVAVAAYAGLWTVVHFREVFKLGRRGFPSEPLGKGLAVLLLLVGSVYVTFEIQRTPNASEYLQNAETRIREGNIIYYRSAVRMGVPGIDELCMKLRDEEDADLAFYGAAGAYHRGDRSGKTRRILHERIEGFKAAARSDSKAVWKEIWKYEWAARLLETPTPAGMWVQAIDNGLHRDSSFWTWWEKAEPSFRDS